MPIIPAVAVPRRALRPWAPLSPFRRFFCWCLRCRERAAQRRHLADLDERMLKDVGLTPSAAARECAKPWWRS
jgi:uncharacterized protein YjiS (DUF1127 family)